MNGSGRLNKLKDSVAILDRLASHCSKARKLHQNHRVPSPLNKLATPSEDSQRSFLLQIKDASLLRGTNPIFSRLSLEINERRVGLIGDNGAGKSSLFRMLCGLDVPQSGSVMVRDLQAHQVSKRRPGLVGMMFQNPDDQIIFPTVAEELVLGFSPSGISRQDGIARSRSFLESRGLAHWSDRSISSLSQGQRQHVCWLALMIASPELLLLDEPFASLDLPGQALLSIDIARACQQVIVSTHLLDHVRHFERVIWLDKGQIRDDGPGSRVCADYQADVAARISAQALSFQ